MNLAGAGLYSVAPFDGPGGSSSWPVANIISGLGELTDARVLVKFGVLADTHYYAEPLGTPHPIQIEKPGTFRLKDNLTKIRTTLDQFEAQGVAFGTILGDVVEDHASWPTTTSSTGNGALAQNLGDLGGVFDDYAFPVYLVAGNHDVSYGTTRTDLFVQSNYYSQVSYDLGQFSQRLDYVFDVNGVRFIAYDNVQRLPGAFRGFRSATPETLTFLASELAKVSAGGADEGMPTVVMAHARADCPVEEGCNQKVDLADAAAFRWTQSAAGTDEYYLEAAGGGDPGLEDASGFNQFVWLDGVARPQWTIGLLLPGRWNYGSNPADGLGFDTVYLRLSGAIDGNSWDPDDAPPGYVEYKYVDTGAAENFEEIAPIFEQAVVNGANLLGVLQGHLHSSRHTFVNGVNYYTFASAKRAFVPYAYGIVDVLFDNTLSVEGFGWQESFASKIPYHEIYGCTTSASSPLLNLISTDHGSHESVGGGSSTLWRFSGGASDVQDLSVNLHETVYGDAESGGTEGWEIYDDQPAGAAIEAGADPDRPGKVYELSGAGMANGYRLGIDNANDWKNTTQKALSFSIKYDEGYVIYVDIQTTAGQRYLKYNDSNVSELGDDRYIEHGLGSQYDDGEWHAFFRDLQADVEVAQPGVQILEVNAFMIRGSGRVDDIKLLSYFPIDTDSDGLLDPVDNCIASPNGPAAPDSGGNEQLDTDQDGFGNACDPDFNGNGIVDPADFSLLKSRFGQPGFPDQDLNGNGVVDPFDFSLFKLMFGQSPGPSGIVP